jgi:hypothetical protein
MPATSSARLVLLRANGGILLADRAELHAPVGDGRGARVPDPHARPRAGVENGAERGPDGACGRRSTGNADGDGGAQGADAAGPSRTYLASNVRDSGTAESESCLRRAGPATPESANSEASPAEPIAGRTVSGRFTVASRGPAWASFATGFLDGVPATRGCSDRLCNHDVASMQER